ncbi:hypothetical protein SUDANB132_00836 [Streptomyces sp. enrichment culture]
MIARAAAAPAAAALATGASRRSVPVEARQVPLSPERTTFLTTPGSDARRAVQ